MWEGSWFTPVLKASLVLMCIFSWPTDEYYVSKADLKPFLLFNKPNVLLPLI